MSIWVVQVTIASFQVRYTEVNVGHYSKYLTWQSRIYMQKDKCLTEPRQLASYFGVMHPSVSQPQKKLKKYLKQTCKYQLEKCFINSLINTSNGFKVLWAPIAFNLQSHHQRLREQRVVHNTESINYFHAPLCYCHVLSQKYACAARTKT